MSTRAQIGFYDSENRKLKDFDALIYKHHDGYPEGMIPILKKTLKRFNDLRGLSDTEYAAAYFVAVGKSDEAKEDKSDEISDRGWGICKDLHGDIEYYYAVSPEGVKAYAVRSTNYLDGTDELFASMVELPQWSFKF